MAAESISTPEYERIFAVLEDCDAASTLDEFKHRLMDALHEHYRFPNTTFLSGPTFRSAFADPDPVTTGRIPAVLDEYQSGWYETDVFSTPESYAALHRSPALSHSSLGSIPTDAATYLERFLYRRQLRSAAVMHLNLAHDAHALVGIFDSEGNEVPLPQIQALGLLARRLSATARTLPGSPRPSWRDRLTPRQLELAELLADGHTNEEIAAYLHLGVDTVKKYVSRIFTATRVRNRAEFVKLVYTETDR